jgi:catechol 2,3-dioxygenase-like lactoylglutathione lyase family enzyme
MENMIDHVILTISDFKRSVAFYAKALNRDVWWATTAPPYGLNDRMSLLLAKQ